MSEPKILKTKCNSCIFLNIFNWGQSDYQIGCDLGKEIFQDNIKEPLVYCKGFCNQKREQKWVEKAKEGQDYIGVVDKENRTLSLVISCLDKDLKKLSHTLSFTNFSMFCDVTISIQSHKDDSKEKLEELTKLIVEKIPSGTKWNLDSLIYKELLDRLQGENYSTRLCGGSWIAFLESGEYLCRSEYLRFRNNINDRKNSSVMIFNDHNYIINRHAMAGLDGHLDKPLWDKLKEFENWKETVLY